MRSSYLSVLFFATVIGFAAIGAFTRPYVSEAGAPGSPSPLNGWAWSSNAGWISFNSADAGSGGGSYGVTVEPDGDMKGYAWSSNIGWIKFGNLSGFPSGGTTAQNPNGSAGDYNAYVSTSTGAVTGWVRVCAGTVKSGDNPTDPIYSGDCSAMTSRQDGWDGWIELSGANHATGNFSGTGGVTYDRLNRRFVGFAWGSDVVGWIEFSPNLAFGTVPPVICLNCNGGGEGTPVTATCTATPPPAVDVGVGIQYSATASGGSGTFDSTDSFTWNTSSSDGTASPSYGPNTTITYGSAGSFTPSVTAKDNMGADDSATCPTATVTDPTPPTTSCGSGSEVCLLIGKTEGTVGTTLVTIRKNQTFVLKWENVLTLGDGEYSCSPDIVSDHGSVIPVSWLPSAGGEAWGGSDGTNNGTVTLSASGVTADTYHFSINCLKPGEADVLSNSVGLRVTNSSIEER